MQGANVEWWLPVLLVGVPPALLALTTMLARLEAWTDRPERRAAQIVALMDDVEAPEELEVQVTRLLGGISSRTVRPSASERLGRTLPSVRRRRPRLQRQVRSTSRRVH